GRESEAGGPDGGRPPPCLRERAAAPPRGVLSCRAGDHRCEVRGRGPPERGRALPRTPSRERPGRGGLPSFRGALALRRRPRGDVRRTPRPPPLRGRRGRT